MDSEAIVEVIGTMVVTVTRCGCDGKDPHASLIPAQPCPTPKQVYMHDTQEVYREKRG